MERISYKVTTFPKGAHIDFNNPNNASVSKVNLDLFIGDLMKKMNYSYIRGVNSEFGYELAFKKGRESLIGEKIDFWVSIGKRKGEDNLCLRLNFNERDLQMFELQNLVSFFQDSDKYNWDGDYKKYFN